MNVWICDDNRKMLYLIGAFVKKYFKFLNEEVVIEEYFNGKEVIDIILKDNKAPDILFTAIRMKMITGYQVALVLKKTHCRTLLIFVSAFSELFFESLQFEPFGYIVKSSINQSLNYYIEMATKKINSKWQDKLEVKYCGRKLGINIDEISIINSADKKTVIELINGDLISTRMSLKEMADNSKDTPLVMISRSQIINLDAIKSVSYKNLLMFDGRNIRISRRKYIEFKLKFNEYVRYRGN